MPAFLWMGMAQQTMRGVARSFVPVPMVKDEEVYDACVRDDVMTEGKFKMKPGRYVAECIALLSRANCRERGERL